VSHENGKYASLKEKNLSPMLTFENQQVKNHIIEGANAALKRAIELGNVK
jgi:hypothetical protein